MANPEVTNFLINNTTVDIKDNTGRQLINKLNLALPIKRSILVVDDSYGVTVKGITPWCDKLAEKLNLTENTDYFNASIDGATVVGSGPSTFYYGLNAKLNSMTTDQKNNITDVFIGGCGNDANNDSNLYNSNIKQSISDLITLCNNNLPNCKIWLCPTNWAHDPAKRKREEWIYTHAYANTFDYTQNCVYLGPIFLCAQPRAMMQNDGKHLSEIGTEFYASAILSRLNGGALPFPTIGVRDGGAVIQFANQTIPSQHYAYATYFNGFVKLLQVNYTNAIAAPSGSTFSFTYGSWTKISEVLTSNYNAGQFGCPIIGCQLNTSGMNGGLFMPVKVYHNSAFTAMNALVAFVFNSSTGNIDLYVQHLDKLLPATFTASSLSIIFQGELQATYI